MLGNADPNPKAACLSYWQLSGLQLTVGSSNQANADLCASAVRLSELRTGGNCLQPSKTGPLIIWGDGSTYQTMATALQTPACWFLMGLVCFSGGLLLKVSHN